MEKHKSDFICKGEQPHYLGGNSSEQHQLSRSETVQVTQECFPYQ
jgi:hypothetical protein